MLIGMTLTTLITLNAVLAATLSYGVVFLLATAVRSDQVAAETELFALQRRETDRIAA
jgi:hypothetical protein